MSATSGSAAGTDDVNPFSSIAVERVMEADQGGLVTVDTSAIKDAIRVVQDYLVTHVPDGGQQDDIDTEVADRAAARAGGTVLAVVGDYGTGKTHLAMRLVRYVRDAAPGRVRCMYLDANADNFLAVYRRFIAKLDQAEVRDRVKRYYAEVVADSLGDSGLTLRLVEGLRSGTSDPTAVVEQFALMENTLLRDLQQRLRTVTDNAAFATALMLLLRPGFETSVWSWLEGKEPDALLVERGVTFRISTDRSALEAMGVVALLHRTRDLRFMLVIDELDKVLSTATNPGDAILDAFKQLLLVFGAAGAMLVLAGLPDFLNVVTKDVLERIGPVVRMPAWTGAETSRLIERSQEQVFQVRKLAPFTPAAVDHVVLLARGIARQIIRLCYGAYRLAIEARTPVTIKIIEDVARDTLYLSRTDEDVRDAVGTVLDRHGWTYQTDYQIDDTDPLTMVDYWITPAGSESGYGILVTGSVLNEDDVAALRHRATAISAAQEGMQGSGTLLVVNGYLPAATGVELGAAFGVSPLLYEPRSFEDALPTALGTMSRRLQVRAGDAVIAAVSEQVERISRQQATLQSQLDDRLAVIASQLRVLSEASRITVAEAGSAEVRERGPSLPREVDRMFVDALDALAELDRFDLLLRDAFSMGEEQASRRVRSVIRSRLSAAETTQAAGIAVLLRKTIATFRDGAGEWYRSRAAATGLNQHDRDELDALCSTYDAISEYLPPYFLGALGDLAASITEEPTMRQARRNQQNRVRDILESLSLRVRRALLSSVAPAI